MVHLPARAEARVEVPRWSVLKRELHDGSRLAFVSPVPCPFNYGYVPDTLAPDGDPMDAVILGPRLPRGAHVERAVVGVVRFIDAGRVDDKWVLGDGALSSADVARLDAFFRLYAPVRRLLNLARGSPGETNFSRVVPREELVPWHNRR